MKNTIRKLKKTLGQLLGVERLQAAANRRRMSRLHAQRQTAAEVFTHYYKENSWGSQESVSGQGSTAKYTENLRKEIPRMLETYKVRAMLDAPCGDFNWFRLVERPEGVRYIGGEIVAELVDRNQEQYRDAQTEFRQIDITRDVLPAVDLWMCRDCLFHFSDRDLFTALANFLRSDIPYLFTSTHPKSRANYDIVTGDFRLLNLERAPFKFPKALLYVDDWIEGFPERQMGLWSRESLARSLEANKAFQRFTKERGK